MRTVEYRGVLRALSSVTNTSKDNGPHHMFRYERLITPDGRVIPSVPVVSGGVIRGALRRVAAAMTHQALAGDGGTLPMAVVHALRTGGSLRETRTSGEVLTGERQAVLRDLIPMFGLFGMSGGGRIMSGRLIVDKAIPVCQETAHLTAHYDATRCLGAGYQPPSVWDLLQKETYSRYADVNDAAASMTVESGAEAEKAIPKGSGNMLWSQETLAAGSLLYHSVILDGGTPQEVGFLHDLMTLWSRDARIGGQRARGMGRVELDYARSVLDLHGDPADEEPPAKTWQASMKENSDAITEALMWL